MTTEQAMHAIDPNSVRKGVSVRAPLAVAWQVFTEQRSRDGSALHVRRTGILK